MNTKKTKYYSPEELQTMARQYTVARMANDPRCDKLLAKLSVATGKDFDTCEAMINNLANGFPVEEEEAMAA